MKAEFTFIFPFISFDIPGFVKPNRTFEFAELEYS